MFELLRPHIDKLDVQLYRTVRNLTTEAPDFRVDVEARRVWLRKQCSVVGMVGENKPQSIQHWITCNSP